MKKLFYIIVCLCGVMAFEPSLGFSATDMLSVRTGEHAGYSRLVFDWDKPVEYSVSQDGRATTLRFSEAAKISSGLSARHVQSINVQGTDPLVVVINGASPKDSKVFKLGERVVLDVYAKDAAPKSSADAVQPATPAREEQEKTAKSAAQKSRAKIRAAQNIEKPAIVSTNAPDDAELKSAQGAPVSDKTLQDVVDSLQLVPESTRVRPVSDADGAQALEQKRAFEMLKASAQNKKAAQEARSDATSLQEEAVPKTKLDKIREEIKQPNQFTISATQAIGMAVFEYAGDLLFFVNRPEVLVRPKVGGPDRDYFMPMDKTEFDSGSAYRTQAMDGAYMRGEGGGLLWRVVVSPNRGESFTPIAPIRRNAGDSGVRSGKIIFPFKTAAKIMRVMDTKTGAPLIVVSVDRASDFTGAAMKFVDFDVLPSAIGMAIRPKVDDLDVRIGAYGVEISRPGGLAILPEKYVRVTKDKNIVERKRAKDANRVFEFTDWKMGGAEALAENQSIMMSNMRDMTEGIQIESFITLAKMNLANGRAAEALGFLNIAEGFVPELSENPVFLALRGAAKAFDWQADLAFQDLSHDALSEYPEIGLWKAFSLAELQDWQQAYESLPDNFDALPDYPGEIRNRLATRVAEVLLRAGEVEKAEALFKLVEDDGMSGLSKMHKAALEYLKGEAERQKGNLDEAEKQWNVLAHGGDQLYQVKGGLALTRLLVERDKIKQQEAIDRLERLRYAWRGDHLEAQVNYWLGRTYFEAGAYIKGMNLMRKAAELSPDSSLGRRVAGDMQSLFAEFYLGDTLDKVSPMDAVSLYESFKELTPPDDEGDKVVNRLAEHMVKADLLDRAGDLFSYQLQHRLSGRDAMLTAVRLSKIRLVDDKPELALQALRSAEGLLRGLSKNAENAKRQKEISLLRARAYSQKDDTNMALSILKKLTPDKNVNRLKASIAWQAGYWDDAAFALEDVILDEEISLTRPLDDQNAMLILQQATAMNLSGDRVGLANLREKYGEAMSQTNKGRIFDVITRARQTIGLADRQTILSTVSEVDLFEEFLNSYKNVESTVN